MKQFLLKASVWLGVGLIYGAIAIALLNMEDRGDAVIIGFLIFLAYMVQKQIDKVQDSLGAVHRKLDHITATLEDLRRSQNNRP